ncbi:MAG: hypothetical protein JRI74_10900, partial [Deltaproteobacteria bacterium]|nr:hypothetical protein [Deltaproteobacteria bacterium]
AGAVKLTCSAQVLYGLEEERHSRRCGLAILDMDISAYSRLTQILTSAVDPSAYISAEVDMDALWEFFFHTGFIYPKKYRLIQSHRKTFKETYQRLYQENPEIVRHFISQKNGRIYGHLSMVRAYQRSWLIHHHAARNMGNKRTGFMVLKQILYYLNGMYRLPTANMDYVMCYYRPDSKFPDIVFGGFERDLNDLRGCSMDLFSYLPYTRLSLGAPLPDEWSLKESSKLDFWELNRFYSHQSGGLLLNLLGLDTGASVTNSLEEVYARRGFLRKWRTYSLKHKGELNAVLIVDQSDLGFNLSELLNGIKVIITNPEGLPWNTLSTAISQLTGRFQTERIPVMLYPFSYVEDYEIPCEKQYQAWILNLQYGNEYLEYMQRRFKASYR